MGEGWGWEAIRSGPFLAWFVFCLLSLFLLVFFLKKLWWWKRNALFNERQHQAPRRGTRPTLPSSRGKPRNEREEIGGRTVVAVFVFCCLGTNGGIILVFRRSNTKYTTKVGRQTEKEDHDRSPTPWEVSGAAAAARTKETPSSSSTTAASVFALKETGTESIISAPHRTHFRNWYGRTNGQWMQRAHRSHWWLSVTQV